MQWLQSFLIKRLTRWMNKRGIRVLLLGDQDAAVLLDETTTPLIVNSVAVTREAILNNIYAVAFARMRLDEVGNTTIRELIEDITSQLHPDLAVAISRMWLKENELPCRKIAV
jgi:hypothetical protein